MQVITGSKREITIREWCEQLEKYVKRANDSFKCFQQWKDSDDLDRLITDANAILETAKQTKRTIKFMNTHGIK